MRFIGLVLVLAGATAAYFGGYKGMTVDEMRSRLASLLNIPGLAPPTSQTADAGAPLASAVAGAGKVLTGSRA